MVESLVADDEVQSDKAIRCYVNVTIGVIGGLRNNKAQFEGALSKGEDGGHRY